MTTKIKSQKQVSPESSLFQSRYHELNQHQREAVDQIDGPVMVLAGPGTGKTEILAMRVANILRETKVDPHQILCLTFTEMGAVNMRSRLLSLIGTPAYYVKIATFHGFCNDIIKEHPDLFSFLGDMNELGDIKQIEIFDKLIDQLPPGSIIKPWGDNATYKSSLITVISKLKQANILPGDFAKIVASVDIFITKTKKIIEPFISINAHQLTDLQCATFMKEFMQIQHTPGIYQNFFNIISAYHQPYAAFLDEPRKVLKPKRTAFKRALKKLYESIVTSFPRQQALITVYRNYQKELHDQKLYDFADMILFVIDKFQTDRNLLTSYQEQFQFILVDEYQDTNDSQLQILKLLGSHSTKPNIFVVGDDKQSIYRFQGASLENIITFHKLHKEHLKLIVLQQNYRSNQVILDAAHSLIQHNQSGISSYLPDLRQDLVAATQQDQASKIQIAVLENERTENYYLATKIQSLLQDGTDPNQIAVLYRNHKDIVDPIDLFTRLHIPFHLEAGQNILHNIQITKLLALLRFIHNPHDREALFYILHYDFLQFDSVDVMKFTHYAHSLRCTAHSDPSSRKDIFQIMLSADDLSSATISDTAKFIQFATTIADLTKDQHNLSFADFFTELIKKTGFLSYVLKSDHKVEYLNTLNTLFAEIKKLNYSDHSLSLAKFLQHIDILLDNNKDISEPPSNTSAQAIRLMTAHKSKGLEFEHVFIIRCLDQSWGGHKHTEKLKLPDGLIRHSTQSSIVDKYEDDRRLFYVALSRAKQHIYITYPAHTYTLNNHKEKSTTPSIFIQELANDLVEYISTKDVEEQAKEHLPNIFLELPQIDLRKQELDYLSGLLENYIMSVTHLNNYLTCPRKFLYQNLLHAPDIKSKHSSYGTAIHSALQYFFAKYRTADLPSKEYLIEKFIYQIQQQLLTPSDLEESIEKGQRELAEFYEHYHDSFVKNTIAEYDFSPDNVVLDDIRITGMIDLVELPHAPDKHANIVDFKTGNPDNKSSDLKPDGDYHRQLVFYKLLCLLDPQFKYTFDTGEIRFISKSKKKNKFIPHIIPIPNHEITELQDSIRQTYADIHALKFDKIDRGETCKRCAYQNTCWESTT